MRQAVLFVQLVDVICRGLRCYTGTYDKEGGIGERCQSESVRECSNPCRVDNDIVVLLPERAHQSDQRTAIQEFVRM